MKKDILKYYNNARHSVADQFPEKIKNILDIGCGQGAFLNLIKVKTGAETWGVEMVKEIGEKAKDKVDKILIGQIEDLIDSIPDDYFDYITFNDVLEHLIEPTKVLEMVKPKLSKNGKIVASIPNVRFYSNLYALIFKKDWKYTNSGILDSTHMRFFTKKSMKRMFEDAGYKLTKQEGINKTKSLKLRLFNLFTFYYFDDIKYLQFLCIAIKV